MKILRRLAREYVLQLILLCLLTVCVVRGLPRMFADRERPEIYTVEIENDPPQEVPEGSVSLLFSGKELLHVNALYLNGKRIPVTYAGGIHYGACRVAVRQDILPRNEPVMLQLGKYYPVSLGVITKTNRITETL